MTFNAGSATATLDLDNQGYKAGIKEAAVGTKKFGDTADKSFKKAEKSAVSLSDVVTGALATGAIAALTKGISTLVNQASKIEDAAAAFTPLLGSAEKANLAVEKINKTAATTPFQFENIADTVNQLLPVMNGNIEDTIDTFRLLGDTAGGNAQKLQSITRGFSKALLKGKPDLESLNMIGEAGVPIFSEMAESMGITKEQLFKMSTQGKLTSDDLTKTFQKMTSEGGIFFNGMEIASKTFSGRMSTLKDNVGLLGAELGGMLLPIFKKFVEGITIIVQGTKEWIAENKELTFFIGSFATIATVIIAVVKLLPLLQAAWTFAMGKMAVGTALATGGISLLLAIAATAAFAITQNWEKVKNIFEPLSATVDVLKFAIKDMFDSISESIGPIKEAFIKLLPESTGNFSALSIVAKTVAISLTILVGVFKALISILKSVIVSAVESIAALGNLITLDFSAAKKNFVNLENTWKETGEDLVDTANLTVEAIKETFSREIAAPKVKAGITPGAAAPGAVVAREDINKFGELGKTIREAQEGLSKFNSEGLKTQKGIDGLTKGISGFAKAAESAMSIASGLMDNWVAGIDNAIQKNEQFAENVAFASDLFAGILEKQLDREVAAVEAAANAKLTIESEASAERLAVIDEEFARRKQLLEDELAIRLLQIEAEREIRDIKTDEESAHDQQAQLIKETNEEDARRMKEDAERDHDLALRDLLKEGNQARKTEGKAAADATTKIEEEKNKRIEALQARKEAREKDARKKQAGIQFLVSAANLELSKRVQIAQATAAAAAGAAQAMSVSVGQFGLPGIAIGASLGALILSTTSANIAAIQSQRITPPAELFLAGGGLVTGPGTSTSDSVKTNVSRDELVVDAARTRKMFGFIDNGMGGGVIIQPGAIIVQGNMDEEMVDLLAEKISEKQADRIHSEAF